MPAFYIVLQESIPDADGTALEGRALSRQSDRLTRLAAKAGVTPLVNFFSASRVEMAGFLEGHKAEAQIPEEEWFHASDGLKTLAALTIAMANKPEDSALASELAEFRRVLEVANDHNVRWHLAIDY